MRRCPPISAKRLSPRPEATGEAVSRQAPMKVKKTLLPFISPDRERLSRLKTANGEDRKFMALASPDRITVLFILSHDRDDELSCAASTSLESMAPGVIIAALGEELDYLVLRDLFVRFRDNAKILSAMASNAGIDNKLAEVIAKEGDIDVIKAFADNTALKEILPAVTDGLRANPLADKTLAEGLEAAANARRDIQAEVEAPQGHDDEELNDLIAQEEGFDSDRFNICQAIAHMTAGEKIKLAHTGDRSVRNLLIKDNNRVVATSVLKNPKLTEQEVVMTVSSTSVSEDIIREIANTRKWMKSYKVKVAMLFNPHTPLSFSLKIVDYLRDRELKQLAKSKGIPGALIHAADRKLKRTQR